MIRVAGRNLGEREKGESVIIIQLVFRVSTGCGDPLGLKNVLKGIDFDSIAMHGSNSASQTEQVERQASKYLECRGVYAAFCVRLGFNYSSLAPSPHVSLSSNPSAISEFKNLKC